MATTNYEDLIALEYHKQEFDLVISDWTIGEFSAYEIWQAFKREKNLPPFVLITGNLSANMKGQVKDINPIYTLEKPFRSREFISIINNALRELKTHQLDQVG